jgi:hypothetical protein
VIELECFAMLRRAIRTHAQKTLRNIEAFNEINAA